MTQNLRGFKKAKAQSWFDGFRQLRNERRLDVVLLQETRTSEEWARRLHTSYARSWGTDPSQSDQVRSFWTSSSTAAGGAAILIHPDSPIKNITELWKDHWTPHFVAITGVLFDAPITVISIYAPTARAERELLFSTLGKLARPQGQVIFGGDFNCTLDPELDRSRAARRDYGSAALQQMLANWDLHDAARSLLPSDLTQADINHFRTTQHTYSYRSAAGGIASSRLDRYYVDRQTMKSLIEVSVETPVTDSDHDAVIIGLADPTYVKPKRTRRPRLRYPLPNYAVTAVREASDAAIEEHRAEVVDKDPIEVIHAWDAFKPSTRRQCLRLLREMRKRIVFKLKRREKKLVRRAHALREQSQEHSRPPATVEGITLALTHLEIDPFAKYCGIRSALISLKQQRAVRQRQSRTRLHSSHSAARIRALFGRLSRTYGSPRVELPADPEAPRGFTERVAVDWKVVTQKEPIDAAIQHEYLRALPPRGPVCFDPLKAPFTEEEVRAALRACPRGKAPGPDGIPNDWYRDHENALVPVLTTLFNHCFETGTLPPSFQAATICCIPKMTKPRTGLDFRPIALLNTDYKIFSRLLMARLRPMLPLMLSETQYGFVPGRQVHDAIDMWTAIQRQALTGRIPATAVAVFLDFAKAYDTLDRGFLTKVLQRHGLPNSFIRVVSAMHLATTAEYSANGELSEPQDIWNGIRQGCPLAPLLFLLAIDTLYEAIESQHINGVQLGAATITTVGFADDTTVYLEHWRDESQLLDALHDFGAASGLRVNLNKCAVMRLHFDPEAPLLQQSDLQLPLTDPAQQIRYLGVQISTLPSLQKVWHTAVQQLQARLHLITTKTTDLLQRVEIARLIAVPKIMFVARHCWPNADTLQRLQTFVQNYVWRNQLNTQQGQGRAWTNRDIAMLPTAQGGLNVPNLKEDAQLLAAAACQRWSEHRTSTLIEVATVLRGSAARPVVTKREPPRPLRLGRSLAVTGTAVLQRLAIAEWTPTEKTLAARNCELLSERTRTPASGRWHRGWWYRDYNDYSADLYRLQRVQQQTHGSFILTGLLLMQVQDSFLFVDRYGQAVERRQFRNICTPLSTLGDVVAIERVGENALRFRCKTVSYPMTNEHAASFKDLCDTLVACYPDVLRLANEDTQLQPRPPTEEEWWFCRDGERFALDWSPTPTGAQCVGHFLTLAEAETVARKAANQPTLRFDPHPTLSPIVPVWTSSRRLTRKRLKKIVRQETSTRGLTALQHKEDNVQAQCPAFAAGLQGLTWAAIRRIPHLATRHQLLLYRLKTGCFSGWDRTSQRRGCPHCPDAGPTGGAVSHTFWECPRAHELWDNQIDFWNRLGLRLGRTEERALLSAVFSLKLPHMPTKTWSMRSAHHVQDPTHIIAIHSVLKEAWRQHCVATFATIWRWRCGPDDQEHAWTTQQAIAYADAASRAAWSLISDAVIHTDGPSAAVDAVEELRELSSSHDPRASTPPAASTDRADVRPLKLLFFDGGSRGNPGPGGAGSVLVESDSTGALARISWCAAFSYPDPTTTNNFAEYQGVVEGLAEARRQGWSNLHVIGDSRLILTQLHHYHPPRNKRLLPLYAAARRSADEVGVQRWIHHLRAYNKMADAAANLAMDQGTLYHRGQPDLTSPFSHLHDKLHGDIARWSEDWLQANRL